MKYKIKDVIFGNAVRFNKRQESYVISGKDIDLEYSTEDGMLHMRLNGNLEKLVGLTNIKEMTPEPEITGATGRVKKA